MLTCILSQSADKEAFVSHHLDIHRLGLNERKEGNVLFNDALNAFYLRLYGIGLSKWKLILTIMLNHVQSW